MWDFAYEQECFQAGARSIGALDEAGRGPLAGPVVAACVLVPTGIEAQAIMEKLGGIQDSKKLSSGKREKIYANIKDNFSDIGIGICEPDTIDSINILQATFLAMKKAIGALKRRPDHLLVDGKLPIPNITSKQQAIIKGDCQVVSIAAASIAAKVERDRIMLQADSLYPEYGFARHKGYGTAYHLQKIKEHGPCPIHRKSFSRVCA